MYATKNQRKYLAKKTIFIIAKLSEIPRLTFHETLKTYVRKNFKTLLKEATVALNK